MHKIRRMLRKVIMFLLFVLGWTTVLSVTARADNLDGAGQVQRQVVMQNLNGMPLSFTENQGQFGEKICFRANARGASFFFSPDEVIYQFTRRSANESDHFNLGKWRIDDFQSPYQGREDSRLTQEVEHLYVKVKFVGANPHPRLVGEGLMQYKCNYFIGNDPSKWRSNVSNYTAIIYKDLYPGIDLKYYGDGRAMKYDFIVQPGADPSVIAIEYGGVNGVSINGAGELVVSTPFADVIERVPYVYQEVGGHTREIPCHYALLSRDKFGFALDSDHDVIRPLHIDPLLSYSTYLGGGRNEEGYAIAVDSSGCAYVTGWTDSHDFPTANPYQGDLNVGSPDVFVTKLSASGNSLIYSTYLGGSDPDKGHGIAVDGFGCAYVTGRTDSPDFPTTSNGYDTTYHDRGDVFVTKLSVSGSSLIYSTYLGGSLYDWGEFIAVDGSGSAYVTGNTNSTDFPTANPYQENLNGDEYDAFVTKLSISGDSLIYSTYLGGDEWEYSYGVAVDDSGCAYVTGQTDSPDFPMANPYDGVLDGLRDVFVTKFSASGDSLLFSTYLGGSLYDWGEFIAVDDSGRAYVTGSTGSADFPTINAYQENLSGGSSCDVFVTKFSSSGDSLIYSTYLGGSKVDYSHGIAVDDSGRAYVTGTTYSIDFPTANPYQGYHNGGLKDVFVTKFSASGDSLIYSTYLGGSHYVDYGEAIAVDDSGCAYVAGYTLSDDFPTCNPYQSQLRWTMDIFVAKFSDGENQSPIAFIDNIYPNPAEEGEEVFFVGHGDDPDGSVVAYSWRSDIDGQLSDQASFSSSDLSMGMHTIYFKVKDDDCAWSEKVSETLDINRAPIAIIDSIRPNPAEEGEEVSFGGRGVDHDGTVIAYNWRSDIDGHLSVQASFSTTDLSGGIHTIYFKVQDDDDAWSEEDSRTLEINQFPIAFIDSIYPNPADIGEEVFFVGHGEDEDGSVIAYNWRSDVDGQLSQQASFSTSDLSTAIHTIYLQVQDNSSIWSEEVSDIVYVGVSCGDLGFWPDPDGWQFGNIPDNMWPESWWQQFDYTQYPYTNHPVFSGAEPFWFPDWSLFVSAFGEDQCYWVPPPGEVVFKEAAVMFWWGLNFFHTFYWKGSCFGFATSSFFFFDDYLDVSIEFPGYTEVHSIPINDESRLMQNIYYLHQYGVAHGNYIVAQCATATPRQTLLECQEMFADPVRDDRILGMVCSWGGHAVNPYMCVIDPVNPEVRHIYVYDNNFPGIDTLRVSVDTSANTWSYNGLPGWGGDKGLFLLEPVSNYTTYPVMPTPPGNGRASGRDRSTSERVWIFLSCTDTAVFESPAGSIGHMGDSLFSTIPDGHPIIPFMGQESRPVGYYLPNGEWTCQFSGLNDSVFSLGLFNDYTVLAYSRMAVGDTESELIRYPGNDSTLLILNPDPESRSYRLEAVCVEPDSEVCYSIRGISIDPGDSTCHSLKGESQLQIDNYGDDRLYDLRVRIASSVVDTTFFHGGISLPDYSSHLIIPDWRQYDDSLMILVDSGMTGSFSDTVFVDNQVEYLRGDVTGDGIIDLGDVLYVISYLYKGGPAPDPFEAGDCDCDGVIDLGDVLYLISYLYKGGPAPGC